MKKILMPLLIIIIVVILAFSVKSLKHDDDNNSSKRDIVENIDIDGTTLEVKYILGNMIDEEIPYGNKVSKVIDIKNDTGKDVSFAIKISEVILSDENIKYTVSYSYDKEVYTNLTEDINLSKDDNLAYNLVVSKNSSLSIKIEFLGNNQIGATKFTGKLNVISNLSDKDIYRKDVLAINSSIENNINALNGINEKGYFIVNVDSLKSEVSNKFKGYVLIDATDYADLKFHYYIYNDKYMLNDYNLVDNDVQKKRIQDIDESIISKFNFNDICLNFSKKGCTDFYSLKFNPNGGKENFYKEAKEVIDTLKSSFKDKDKKVYVYDILKDINNNTSIRGYVLINNTVDNPEYYLYLTNDIYMVSGYNLTKLGDFSVSSKTIRSYSDTSFNLSSSNASSVCSFSGFQDCVNPNGEKI